jgi:hypothetical protein
MNAARVVHLNHDRGHQARHCDKGKNIKAGFIRKPAALLAWTETLMTWRGTAATESLTEKLMTER